MVNNRRFYTQDIRIQAKAELNNRANEGSYRGGKYNKPSSSGTSFGFGGGSMNLFGSSRRKKKGSGPFGL